MYENAFSRIIHTIGQSIYIPVLIVLLLFVTATVVEIGMLIAEAIVERRKAKEDGLGLIKKIDGKSLDESLEIIEDSALLGRQKRAIATLATARGESESSIISFAQKVLAKENAHYRRILMPTDLIAKLGPMFGLMCTLIPLGPGIVALGKGDIAALSTSIGVAFDGTIVGVASAAVCFFISYLRSHWYEGYTTTNESLFEDITDKMISTNRYEVPIDETDELLPVGEEERIGDGEGEYDVLGETGYGFHVNPTREKGSERMTRTDRPNRPDAPGNTGGRRQ